MKLVFIHGWGLDVSLWDGVCALLSDVPQERVDLGYFAAPSVLQGQDNILVGHSLGFVHGLTHTKNWRGWIAVNSFPRFVRTESVHGCATKAELRDITLRLARNSQQCVADFRKFIGAPEMNAEPKTAALREGLDLLRDADVAETATTLPGLVIASEQDPLVPLATSRELAVDKDIAVHSGNSHLLPLTDPVFCATSIRDFWVKHVRCA